MSTQKEGVGVLSEMLLPRGPERRGQDDRRAWVERRYSERRDPARATAGRRGIFPFDRRIAERRMLERREHWPSSQAQ